MGVLEAKGINKKFGKNEVLHSVDISLEEGEIVGFVGPNGAGKSTFIKSVLGLYHIDSGSIKICDFDVQKDFENALKNVGCIIENPDLYDNISGRKNLKIASLMHGLKKNQKSMETIIKLVKLENRIDDKVKTYSLGMKQRLP
ncbi:MAG: ABC transporter ATP-binding protein, partial [Bacilli bacterium]|nr:ABC transporter ATP-binding protein [Bacilli bacterium]